MLSNMKYNKSHGVFGVVVEALCNHGYSYGNGSTVEYIQCGEGGIWDKVPRPCAGKVLGKALFFPDSKVHGANMGPTWGREDSGGLHVGHMYLVIWVLYPNQSSTLRSWYLLVTLFPNNSRKTPIARPLGRGMGVSREFEIWPKFYTRSCCDVCIVVLYFTAI